MKDKRKTILMALIALAMITGVATVVLANDVGPLGPSVAVDDAANGTNDTVVEPGGTVWIDVGLNTTQTADKKYTSPGLNVTLPSGWDIDEIHADAGFTFKDKGNIGEWVSLNNKTRSNFTYEVNVPGGTPSGNYTVDATGSAINATTDNRHTDSTSTIITVNSPPVANFTYTPSSPTTQDSITFDATSSSDPDGTIQSYNWSFGDGNVANETGDTTSYSYADNGSYTVTLTVTDDNGVSNTTSQTVNVSNVAPNVAIAANTTSVQVGETVAFNNSTSSDPDGSIVGNAWEFGDGNTATGESTTHSYSSAGTYQVNLTVTDDDGATNTTNVDINVSAPPTVDINANQTTVLTGEAIAFDNGTSSDPDGTIVDNSWDFGDGNTATGASTTHSYADNGTYTVTLTVTDNDGLTNSTTTTITVNNRAPNVDINTNKSSPVTVETGEAIQFDNGTSSDDDGSIVSNAWEFGDGTTSTGTPTTYSYASAGTYQVNLTVTDDDGATNTTNISVEVNAPPVANFSFGQASAEPTINESIGFTAINSTDPDGSIASYSWDFGDGNTSTGENATNTFANDNSYTVNLTVTDNDGLTNSTQKSVNVKVCRALAIANYDTADQQINLYEIQFGISWWQTNSVVPNANEQIADQAEIQNRINDWQGSNTVSC